MILTVGPCAARPADANGSPSPDGPASPGAIAKAQPSAGLQPKPAPVLRLPRLPAPVLRLPRLPDPLELVYGDVRAVEDAAARAHLGAVEDFLDAVAAAEERELDDADREQDAAESENDASCLLDYVYAM